MPPPAELEAIIRTRLEELKALASPSPIAGRINEYLKSILGADTTMLPVQCFDMDLFGLSRTLSLPATQDEYKSETVTSYRLKQGILHNPKSDRRTTEGVFHVAEGGLPIPGDKKVVPLETFAAILKVALNAPASFLRLPYTATEAAGASVWASLYLRPMVSPEVPGFAYAKSMETLFLVPGSLVCNLDFVESVFGNAGNPRENNAALDVEHWSGHTGCIILAPHLTCLTKKQVGLPHFDKATERQRRDGMCYKDEKELYNDGKAFKLTSRDECGVIVTVIADNYFGYCKKEVKTQLSYAANLLGMCEEEHAGGALTFAAYDLGEEFSLDEVVHTPEDHNYAEALECLGPLADAHPEGYASDKRYDNIFYVPQNVRFRLYDQSISWSDSLGAAHSIRLKPNTTYVLPSGYKIEMLKPAENRRWRIIGTVAEPCLCHKPSTVSGGGKSEISKSINDACIIGSVFVMDFKSDMEQIDMLLNFDYSTIYRDPVRRTKRHPSILEPKFSLGSVIKLFTHSEEYTDGYNDFIRSIPSHVLEMLLVIKRYYKPSWEADWKKRFSVDLINGMPGHELKYKNARLSTNFLRVGYEPDGAWRTLGTRKDFYPATKIQMEDDITASVVLPARDFSNLPLPENVVGLKFVGNCEYRLFQRPDDAIVRGYDKQAEKDMAGNGNFISNFQPLTKADAQTMVDDAIRFDYFTPAMKELLRAHAESKEGPAFVVSSANPRLVDGAPSKNPRYLQNRPDLLNPRGRYLAEVGMRLSRRLKPASPLYTPVNLIVPGRRNNPPEKGSPALCSYNPIHYMELPELFMEFISSMTGKSPSTTGAGSEGALTKGPFNALLPIIDLNSAFVSALLTQCPTFVTSTAYVGPHYKVNHDISLLIPEVFSRMSVAERDPAFLIKNGHLERCRDFQYNGKNVPASRLGWRMTAQFERVFFGRVFNNPGVVLTPEMLRPELQDKGLFADSVQTITDTHQRVAELYFADGSIELAVPPLKALLTLMARGSYEGATLNDDTFRKLFSLSSMLESRWYQERLEAKQKIDAALWGRHLSSIKRHVEANPAQRGDWEAKLSFCQKKFEEASSPEYLRFLNGTIGAPPKLK